MHLPSTLLLALATTAAGVEVDVPVGASVAQAIAQVHDRLGKEPVTIRLAPGVHRLAETLVLTGAHTGTAAAPVVITGEIGNTIVSGGRTLEGLRWVPQDGGILAAEVPTDLDTDQLFVNGEALVMARYPNWRPFAPGVKFHGSAADAVSPERVARWADPTGGIIHAMHAHEWGDQRWTITGKDAAGALTMVGGWQNNRPTGMHPKYRMVENIREELDAQGEWYHDRRQHRLLVIPPAGVDLATATIEAVRLTGLIHLRGTQAAPVRWVTLRGLTFQRTARTFMDNREPLMRSDWTISRSGALFTTGAEDCTVEDCTFDQVGGNAVFVSGYNRRIIIRRTEIERCGTNAIAFVGLPIAVRNPAFNYRDPVVPVAELDLTPGPKTDDYPADCVVDDCLLSRFAQTEKQSTGVQIQMALRITVRNSSIYDCPRAAINIGDGCWGGHLIEGNDVFDTVKETGDHGSFNAWGRDRFWSPSIPEINQRVAAEPRLPLLDAIETIVLRHNRWRYDHQHGWDVDLDDGSSNYLIEDNLCLNKGIKLREGFHRTVRNNICVGNGLHPHVWPDGSGDIVTGNIFPGGYKTIRMPAVWGTEVDRNLLGSEAQRRPGQDTQSVVGDPRFLDPARGDFRVAEDSPAKAIGFRNFSMEFGVRTPRLKAKARHALDTPLPTIAAMAEATPITWQGATAVSVTTIGQVSATGLPTAAGVLLTEVPPTSAAARMGLAPLDVVQRVNGQAVRGTDDLLRSFQGTGPHTVTIWRQQAERNLVLTP